MKSIINKIFEQIVQKNYNKSQIFINHELPSEYECKSLIIKYIKKSCLSLYHLKCYCSSFEMLLR